MEMNESSIKLEWTDICRHEPHCEGGKWFYHTVPSYRVYFKAVHWLKDRGYKLICAEGEKIYYTESEFRYTGRYTFKFLCEQEYLIFVLRWS